MVLNLELTFNGFHFAVSWDQPLEPNGNLSYSVSLVGVSLVTRTQVSSGSGMQVSPGSGTQVFSGSAVVTDTQVLFGSAGEVYTLYTAVVVPQTGGGMGPESTATFTTPQQSKQHVAYCTE